MVVEITKTTALGLITDQRFPALRDEYARECALLGLPDPAEKVASYMALDASPAFTAFGAYIDDALVGFVTVIAPVLPHYGVCVAVAESLFVGAQYRKSGAGMALIRTAEQHAAAVGSPALLFSAPAGGRLERLLPRIGYRATNVAFMKEVQRAE